MNVSKSLKSTLVFFLMLFCSSMTQAVTLTSYYHNDLLGSPVVISDEFGTSLSTESYRPFGETMNTKISSQTNPVGFTGKQHDKSTGLTYFGARYYDPVIGRFMGMDPASVSESDLYTFNRYSYANNNPYKYVDPDGRATVYAQLELKGQLGSFIGGLMSDNSYNALNAKGAKLAIGLAVSFPFFGDGAEYDLGLVGSADAIGVNMDESSSFISLPGVSGGGAIGLASGSVVDLRGQSTSINVQTNIGKKISKTVVDILSSIAPEGRVKNFVDRDIRKAAGSLLGLVASGSLKLDENQDIKGVEFGLAKGFNFGVSADVGGTGVCSIRSC